MANRVEIRTDALRIYAYASKQERVKAVITGEKLSHPNVSHVYNYFLRHAIFDTFPLETNRMLKQTLIIDEATLSIIWAKYLEVIIGQVDDSKQKRLAIGTYESILNHLNNSRIVKAKFTWQ